MSNYQWSNPKATITSFSNCEDGKIVSGKEFLDAIHVNEIFSNFIHGRCFLDVDCALHMVQVCPQSSRSFFTN
jgi:hypothetical protein